MWPNAKLVDLGLALLPTSTALVRVAVEPVSVPVTSIFPVVAVRLTLPLALIAPGVIVPLEIARSAPLDAFTVVTLPPALIKRFPAVAAVNEPVMLFAAFVALTAPPVAVKLIAPADTVSLNS
jgi:hypothetical protein